MRLLNIYSRKPSKWKDKIWKVPNRGWSWMGGSDRGLDFNKHAFFFLL